MEKNWTPVENFPVQAKIATPISRPIFSRMQYTLQSTDRPPGVESWATPPTKTLLFIFFSPKNPRSFVPKTWNFHLLTRWIIAMWPRKSSMQPIWRRSWPVLRATPNVFEFIWVSARMWFSFSRKFSRRFFADQCCGRLNESLLTRRITDWRANPQHGHQPHEDRRRNPIGCQHSYNRGENSWTVPDDPIEVSHCRQYGFGLPHWVCAFVVGLFVMCHPINQSINPSIHPSCPQSCNQAINQRPMWCGSVTLFIFFENFDFDFLLQGYGARGLLCVYRCECPL